MPRLRVIRYVFPRLLVEEKDVVPTSVAELGEVLGLREYSVVCCSRVLGGDEELEDGREYFVLSPRVGVLVARVLGPRENPGLETLYRAMALRATPLGGGALVSFTGFVKGYVAGNRVDKLVYEAYRELADKKLYEIAERYSRVPGVIDIAILHRVGELVPGDFTVYILVSSRTRHEAFHTAALVLEEVKHRAPIYKLEERSDGAYWVLGDGIRVRRNEASREE